MFERHIEKHSPMQHGERLCQKCEQILGQTFANHLLDTSLSSSSSSTPSSLSSASSGRPHHSAFCQSYQVLASGHSKTRRGNQECYSQADISSSNSSRANFKFPFEDVPPPVVVKPKPKFERPIQLADVELYRFISVQFIS